MISIYRKYHIAYWCVGIIDIIVMVAVMIGFWRDVWYFPVLVTLGTIPFIMVDVVVFMRLASKKLSKEVLPLFYNCQVHEFINELNRLFAKKAKGANISLYNSLVARGYGSIDDYDSVYECCQKIKAKGYKAECHRSMIEYYLKNEQFDKAQEEMEALRYIRIKQGNYEGAEEHYQKQLDTIKPLYPITEASYSHALGKLLFLKGEPERARKYLQKAVDLGGDTKYKKFAEELLLKLDEE